MAHELRHAAIRLEVRRGHLLLSRPVGDLAGCDLGVVDELARIALEAQRHGCNVRLTDPPEDLRLLLDLAGVAHLFGL